MIKVGIIVPDRGDRQEFLNNCIRMIAQQTHTDRFCFVVDPSIIKDSDTVDITKRYKLGYKVLSKMKPDVIACMENDDWYSPEYLSYMLTEWEAHGRPDLFGPNCTFYYHLKLKKYFLFRHDDRSMMMSTFIKPGLDFTWPLDHDPYTDAWLWTRQNGIKNRVTFHPKKMVHLGIKHGVGKLGGRHHTDDGRDSLIRYANDDNGFFKNLLDEESYNFYSNYPL